MAKGIFTAKKKDGSIYFRSSINRQGKKISLGSFSSEKSASKAYKEAVFIFGNKNVSLINYRNYIEVLPFQKVVSLVNLRDNGIYFKTPIYLRGSYFSYYLSSDIELKFDNEDLFYYSSHTIMKRGGHLFVNDYGTQYSLNARYGIKQYGISGRDFKFVNNDNLDYRYENILIINKFIGVSKIEKITGNTFQVHIHINGNFFLGSFDNEIYAAICYNKGVDIAQSHGIFKSFTKNYIESIDSVEYKSIYSEISLPKKYISYINSRVSTLFTESSR